mmetsp:Transcript_36204/g.79590  ORF Transcript_36204/g.79590 Transcript_36204/m.79590 type:complete len:157 (+) Transcript_36204:166-636(+)
MDIQEAALEEGALREAFNIFDQDNDGVISAAELKKMMAKLGNSLTDAEVKDIISEAGSSSTNSITLAQFNKLMTLGHKEGGVVPDVEDEMKSAFAIFDKDGDGFISPKEMIAALTNFGITLTERETTLLIAEATLTSGGQKNVSYEVFKKVMLSGK